MKTMKGSKVVDCAFFAVFIFFLSGKCFAEEVLLDVAPMEKTEQEALYSAIQGFVGNWWNGSDLYPDPCGWTPIQGVSCDVFEGLWYVTALNIGPMHDNSLSCALNFEFRPHLFELRHLKSLSFFNCSLSRHMRPFTIPTANWEKLANSLESLEFRSNPGLAGEIPASFGVLKNLQSLVLIENGLADEIPPDIGKLIKLKRLVLAGNSLSGKIPDTFGGLKDLLIFDVSRNSLSGPLPFSLGGLTSLLKLDLSNNNLEGSLLKEFAYLKNLTLLDLRNNKFSGGLEFSLQEMDSLREMVLSNNPMGGEISSLKWEKLQNLVVLELSNMSLTGGIPESISELKRLRFLGLSENNFTGNISPKLETLPCINAMYLSGNNLTGQLQFSEGFYRKMGRRFGAWNNPNLCYPTGGMSPSYVPYEVRPCQPEVKLAESDVKAKLGNVGLIQNFYSVESLGISRYGSNGIWWTFLVEILVMGLILNAAYVGL